MPSFFKRGFLQKKLILFIHISKCAGPSINNFFKLYEFNNLFVPASLFIKSFDKKLDIFKFEELDKLEIN